MTWPRRQIVGRSKVIRLDQNVKPGIERSFGLTCKEGIFVIAPRMDKDATQATSNAAEMTKTGVGYIGAGWKVTGRVEERSGAIEGVDHVVDSTALLFLAVGCAEVHPVASVHSCTGGGAKVLIALLLERGEPRSGEVEDESAELLVDPNVGIDVLEDGVVFGILAFV